MLSSQTIVLDSNISTKFEFGRMAGPKLFVIYRPNSYDGLFTTPDTTVLGVCLWEGMVVALTRARLRCSTLWISRGGRPLEIDCHHR